MLWAVNRIGKRRGKREGITGFYALLMVICLVIISLPVSALAAGSERRDLLGNGEDYTAILYDSTNGLPTSEANTIVQSSDGFIWIGGYSGLSRYDGSNFYRFDSSYGISSVFSLYVDSKDRIWIGTNENGIACYDHGEMKVYGRVEGLKSYSIRSISEDGEGNILIATTQGIAYVGKDDLQVHVIDDPQVNMEYVTELIRDNKGHIFGLTQNGAVFQVENCRISAFYQAGEFGSNPVNCLYPDPAREGILYAGTTESELLTIDLNSSVQVQSSKSVQPLSNVNAILRVGKILWIAATNGIGYLDEHSQFHELNDIPMNNSIGNVITDHEGNIWFTSTRQGVMKLVSDRFTDISKYAGLESVVVNSTCVDGKLLYLGTDRGLQIIDSESYASVTNELTQLRTGIRIRCVKKDSKGNLWFCTHGDNGLVRYNPKTKKIMCFNEENGLDANRVRTVLERQDGSIAAATAGNGVFIINGDEVTRHYGQDSGIRTTDILSLEEDLSGRLYLGSDGDGIYVIDSNKVSRIGYEDGLTSEVVMRIKWDEKREGFWIITSNSIEYMKDGKITPISKFPYSNNYDIYFNNSDGAWILSSNGIYVTKVSELLSGEEIEYNFYNTKSGLPYIATGNSRSFLDDSGNLYISGTTGVCRVNINADDNGNSAVKLAIPSVELDDRLIPVRDGKGISIPAGSKRLVINAYALTFGLSNPRISYYLEGFDKEAIHTTKQDMQPVLYTNLDGGKYTFHLEVIDDQTGQVEKSITLPISKESSPYESVVFWFLLMAAGILIATVLIWRHFQKKEAILLKKQQEDEKFITQIMHTFAKCVDMRDKQNQGHSFRVAYYTRLLAQKLAEKRGYNQEKINEYYNIALLHDIGKISIPDAILNKPERLNDEEYEVMKSHAINGEHLLKEVNIVPDLAVGAGCHHERLDGKGYPRGLKGDEIPEAAKLIAVADTFDAMYSTRPYRTRMPLEKVMEEFRRIRGTQLDPDVVDTLFQLYEEGELDWQKVEAATAYQKEPLKEEQRKPEKTEKEPEKGSEEFQKSLGLFSEDKK